MSLKGMFCGTREVVAEPKKRPVGRPKKVRADEVEEPPEELRAEVAALCRRGEELRGEVSAGSSACEVPVLCDEAANADIQYHTPIKKKVSREEFKDMGRQGAEFGRLGGRPAKPEAEVSALVPSRTPLKRERDETFGLSQKAQLVELHEKLKKTQPHMSAEDLVRQLARETHRAQRQVRKVIEAGEKWMKLLQSKGHTPTGLSRDEAQRPRHMRARTKRFGTVLRAPGGGRKSEVGFMYPVIEIWFSAMRENAHYVDKADLVRQFRRVAQMYIDRAETKQEDQK